MSFINRVKRSFWTFSAMQDRSDRNSWPVDEIADPVVDRCADENRENTEAQDSISMRSKRNFWNSFDRLSPRFIESSS